MAYADDAAHLIADLSLQEGVGAKVRAAQLKTVQAQLRRMQAQMWPRIQRLTEQSMEKADDEAAQAAAVLDAVTSRALGRSSEALKSSWEQQARASVSAFVARERAGVRRKLSARVYKNQALSQQLVEAAIRRGVALGKSSREMASDVKGLIRPDTPGGISYSAMRLARTEIANAHHTAQVVAQQGVPWVDGFKWNLSGSHPWPDICNEYADHGVWSRGDVPKSKPHPHCLCYLTPALMPRAEFISRLKRGDFDDFLSSTGAARAG